MFIPAFEQTKPAGSASNTCRLLDHAYKISSGIEEKPKRSSSRRKKLRQSCLRLKSPRKIHVHFPKTVHIGLISGRHQGQAPTGFFEVRAPLGGVFHFPDEFLQQRLEPIGMVRAGG